MAQQVPRKEEVNDFHQCLKKSWQNGESYWTSQKPFDGRDKLFRRGGGNEDPIVTAEDLGEEVKRFFGAAPPL